MSPQHSANMKGASYAAITQQLLFVGSLLGGAIAYKLGHKKVIVYKPGYRYRG